MFFTINLYSKNLNSINKFLNFFGNKTIKKKLKINFFTSRYQKPVKKKILTILKSPHVNKKAQEQFEYRIYKKKLVCFMHQPFLFLIIFKLVRFRYFSDVHVLIKFKSDYIKPTKCIKQTLDFSVLNYVSKKKFFLINYFKILEVQGEFLINKIK